MSSEWGSCTLGEFVRLQRGHDLTASEQQPGNVPIMGSAGQNGTHNEARANGPGVVVGRSGASAGRVHFCEVNYWPHNTCLYVTDFLGNNPRFAYYLLQTLNLAAFNSGSAQPSLNRNFLYTIPLKLPGRGEQDSIVALLQSLDDRITLMRETNATLEAIAQALFKSWFVDFDPVRAKQEGRVPEGMDEATAALFPDGLEESVLGWVPRGWQVAPLSSISTVIMGLSPKGDSYNSDGLGVPLINGPVEFGDYFPVQTKWTTASERLANANDLIFCVRGSTTGRRVVSDGEYCIGRGVCVIRAHNDHHSFLYQTINFGLNRLLSKTTGSVFPSLSGPDIKGFQILAPTKSVVTAYDEYISPLIKRQQSNQRQIETLANLRDTLLPRLISGQLRLSDAEALIA